MYWNYDYLMLDVRTLTCTRIGLSFVKIEHMPPDILRTRVWDEMLLAEMRANYFAELVAHYIRWEQGLRVLTLVASSGAVATALTVSSTSPIPIVKVGMPILASIASFWLLLRDYGRFSRDASQLHDNWQRTHSRYEELWNNLDDADAQRVFYEIYSAADAFSVLANKFPNKRKRLSFWLDQASQQAIARYA